MTTDTQAKPAGIPQRADMKEEHTWKLADLYPDNSAWESDFQAAADLIDKAEQFKGKLTGDAAVLWECLETSSNLNRKLSRLYQYAYLNKDLDNRVSEYQAMTERAAMLASQAGAAFSFVDPELLTASDESLLKLADQFPKTDIYDFYIRELIRSRPHIRSAEVEELLANAANMARGADTIFSMLDDADIKYPSIKDENGNDTVITKQRHAKFMESTDRRVREDAHKALYIPYKEHINTTGASFAASVNKDVFYARARNFGSCLESSLDSDNIPLSVYNGLLDNTEANLDGLHSYVRARKNILGLDSIRTWDLLNPLFPDEKYEVVYDNAVQKVIDACAPLGGQYVKKLTEAFGSRWIDVFETEGKGSGAYSYGTYDCHPFVLMNYNDTVDNMFTLAHEMGHALHSYLSNATQPYEKSSYSIFVAEVASTLNEGLLLELLLQDANEGQRKYLLTRYLDNTLGTYFHQVMYARFELAVHEKVEKNEALSPDMMNDLWRELTQKYYGPNFEMDELTPLKWSRIPHFYRAFYVYQYATSYAASQAILSKFLNGEAGIIDKYLVLLKSGGKDHPIELLKKCGVDMSTPDPVNATLKLFAEKVKELEGLV